MPSSFYSPLRDTDALWLDNVAELDVTLDSGGALVDDSGRAVVDDWARDEVVCGAEMVDCSLT
jgi:hypothetical protein